MILTSFVEEDFANYKEPAMFLGTSKCDGKCWRELGLDRSICQNSDLSDSMSMVIGDRPIITRYLENPITKAIVIGGLEPFDIKDEVLNFIEILRNEFKCNDPVIVYTGYYPEEIIDEIKSLLPYDNIIIKFGRYIPNSTPRFDEVLGVELVSNNQYARDISFFRTEVSTNNV